MKSKTKKRLFPSLCCAVLFFFMPISFSACEKDNLKGVTITQTTTVEYDYSVLPEYKDFKSIAKREYLVPGLNEGIVPQGMDVWEEKNLLLISGYFESLTNTSGSPSSMLVAVDLKTGEMAGKYCLKNIDGTDHSRHVGGVAITEKNLFLANGGILFRIPLSQIAPKVPYRQVALLVADVYHCRDELAGFLRVYDCHQRLFCTVCIPQ